MNAKSPTLLTQILHPRCPRCGEGRLLRGWLGYQDACSACHLSFQHQDNGDGPTFFAIMIVGIIVTSAAGIIEYRYEPPMWLHAVIWIPLTFILCFAVLRAFKAGLILLEYRTGRLRQPESEKP